MGRLFKKKEDEQKGLWRRVVDLALTDVRVAARGIDAGTLERLEEELLAADFGVRASLRLADHVETLHRRGKVSTPDELREALAAEIRRVLEPSHGAEIRFAAEGPTVILVVGVNGVGKTTTIGKLAHALKGDGRSVLLAATDTFRAGAIEQLREWSERVDVGFVGGTPGGDPAAVAYDAIDGAEARGADVVLVDTAGRLHTDRNLMEELRKIERVVARRLDGAPHETLMVLDATIGQNAVSQLRTFGDTLDLSGIVLAKLDSSARGGIVVALQEEFGVPVKLIGTGEGLDDVEPFNADAFVDGLFGAGEKGASR